MGLPDFYNGNAFCSLRARHSQPHLLLEAGVSGIEKVIIVFYCRYELSGVNLSKFGWGGGQIRANFLKSSKNKSEN